MKKTLVKINAKLLTRLIASGISLVAISILLLTGWFIMKSLNDVSVAKKSDEKKTFKVEGVNNALLEKVQKFIEDKNSDAHRLKPGLTNPFKSIVEPPAPPGAAPPGSGNAQPPSS